MSTTTPAPDVADGEQCLTLSPVSWEQYEAVLSAFPEQAGLRVTYVDGRLTLLSPIRRRHDWHEDAVGRVIEAVAFVLGIGIEVAGHTTYRRDDLRVGVEGDRTYYLGANAELMRGPVDVDLATQPPPDLAVEVELTHKADDSVLVWGRLGVPEVWCYNVDRGSLTFLVRRDDGRYEPVTRSAAFPVLLPDDVLALLRNAAEIGWSRWTAELVGRVNDVLTPRLCE